MHRRTPVLTLDRLTACFEFLDRVRASGSVNMYHAAPLLRKEFGIVHASHAREICQQWRDTFSSKQTARDRAQKAIG